MTSNTSNFSYLYKGSYHDYYKRNDNDRLCNFERKWFENKICLDVGCNSGKITSQIAADFNPCHILGVDVDPTLIDGANSIIKRAKYDLKHNSLCNTASSSTSSLLSTEKTIVGNINKKNFMFQPRSITLNTRTKSYQNGTPTAESFPLLDTSNSKVNISMNKTIISTSSAQTITTSNQEDETELTVHQNNSTTTTTIPNNITTTSNTSGYPFNIAFQCQDVMTISMTTSDDNINNNDDNKESISYNRHNNNMSSITNKNRPTNTPSSSSFSYHQYDTIICLSLTKWIHLNYGDKGLLSFFTILYDLCCPNGLVILEYQPWKSYLNKKKLNAHIKSVFDSIQIRPEQFEDVLGQKIGFLIDQRVGVKLEEAKGYQRPILILRKPLVASRSRKKTIGIIISDNNNHNSISNVANNNEINSSNSSHNIYIDEDEEDENEYNVFVVNRCKRKCVIDVHTTT